MIEVNHVNYFSGYQRNGTDQDATDVIMSKLNQTASKLELYYQLARVAPSSSANADLLQVMEEKNASLIRWCQMYRSLTGNEPTYYVQEIPFQGYVEGLQKAYQFEIDAIQEYRYSSDSLNQPMLQAQLLAERASEEQIATQLHKLIENRANKKDYGSNPYVVDINKATKENDSFRTAIWTGNNLQVTLMSIKPGDDIGLEIHPTIDQFIRLEQGQGLVEMGKRKNQLTYKKKVKDDYAIMVPAGTWHNVTNTGKVPMKLYAIYAPPEHPFGTVHMTKADAMAAERYLSHRK